MDRPKGLWLTGWPMQLLFEADQVKPGDVLHLHNSPVWGASKVVLVVESRAPGRYYPHAVEIYIPEYCGESCNAYCRPIFREAGPKHVKAWCRPPLDLEL